MTAQVVKLTIVKDAQDETPASRYAQELRQAILDAAPPGTDASRVRSNPADMQLGETIVIEIVTVLVLKAVFEGIEYFRRNRGKVRVQLESKDGVIVVDETKGELAAAYAELEKRLASHDEKK